MTGNAVLQEQDASERVATMNEQMEALAAAGHWDQVADLVTRRNALLPSIKNSSREAALVAARRTTIRLQRMAESARKEVSDKLAKLQRGKRATQSYQAHV